MDSKPIAHTISIYKRKEDVGTAFNRDVRDFLSRIKSGVPNKWRIEEIRAATSKEERDKLKTLLPAATMSGTFSKRNNESLIESSGLLCLDFDGMTSDELLELRTQLYGSDYVFSLFTSPSGAGLKVLVRIPKEPEFYKEYYKAIMEHFDHPKLDTKVHDISRLCFESYDPELYINEDSKVWDVKHEPELESIGNENVVFELKSQHRIIDLTLKWWLRKYGSIKGQRNSNIYILASALNRFGVSKSDAVSVCGQFQDQDFTMSEIQKAVDSGYRRVEDHGISKYEDAEAKDRLLAGIMSGKSETQLKKELSDFSPAEVEEALNTLKESLSAYEYWTTSKNGAISLSHHRYKHFLEQSNYMKFYPPGSDNYVFIKVKENIIEDTNSALIKDFVLDDLMERGTAIKAYDFMASQTKYFKDDYLSLLSSADINLKEDTADECYLYFKNCCLKITKDTIETIDYLDMDGYVWKKQIVNRPFTNISEDEIQQCVFKRFVWLISGQDEDRFKSLISVIGYLLHGFKTSANNRAIIFNDEAITDTPNGGSGKGIFCNAISKVKKVVFIDGKMFDFNSSFAYQTVSADTQVLVFDDVKKNFSFENLFSLITEGITLEKKNKDAIKIPISKSPKIVITTNYTIGGVGGSFERRKFEVELSSYFSSKHTPLDEFGHLLFDDWDAQEWLRFDNFMVQCVRYYLTNGLVSCEYKNLATRKFIKETSSEFYEWVNDGNIIHNHVYSKANICNQFLEEYPDPNIKKFMSTKRFTGWIKAYANYKGLDIKEGKNNEVGRYIEVVDTNLTPAPQNENPF